MGVEGDAIRMVSSPPICAFAFGFFGTGPTSFFASSEPFGPALTPSAAGRFAPTGVSLAGAGMQGEALGGVECRHEWRAIERERRREENFLEAIWPF